jgi:hypothetical protein
LKIKDYIEKNEGFYIAPEVQYSAEYLENHGDILFVSFTFDNAVSKAAEMYTVFQDEELADWKEVRSKFRISGDWSEIT